MCDFNLAWETYSFHSSKCAELENEFLKEMNLLNDMILNGKDNLESIFSHISKTKRVSRIKAFGFKKPELALAVYIEDLSNDSNLLLNAYKKQMDAVDALIKLCREKKIPKDLNIDLGVLFNLKNVTATLAKELSINTSRIIDYMSE
jgi:hypothetical protein